VRVYQFRHIRAEPQSSETVRRATFDVSPGQKLALSGSYVTCMSRVGPLACPLSQLLHFVPVAIAMGVGWPELDRVARL
jgi:hypothetical protein